MTALTTILTGSVIPERRVPTARIAAEPTYGVIGSVVRLDARASTDPDALPLTYSWSFISVPIGSVMRLEGFRVLDSDSGLVSFSPDKVGNYEVQLIANNGAYDSDPVVSTINIRVSLVPDATGLVPDGKWIWSYLRDVWTAVEGKESFETLWSALIQIVGAELLKLYETDYNKSIRDIQELFQRRWLSYQPELALDDSDVYFYLGSQAAGTDAVSTRTSFSVARAGAPKLSGIAESRVVTVGGIATTVVRTSASDVGATPVTAVTVATDLPISTPSQFWRVPHTLSSLTKNFEELGVTVGDVLWMDVTLNGAASVASIKTQVVGVSGNSLGFVVTDEEIKAGLVPTIPPDYYRTVAASFNISGLGKAPDGGVLFAGNALALKNAVSSEVFKRNYFNRKLTPYDAITPMSGWTFNLHPRRIIRNRRIPVDTSLASVPGLQEYIVQPETVEKSGKVYQVRGDKEFELPGKPLALQENTDYVIDTDYAFNGDLVFKTGSSIVEGEEADFIDRSVAPGDVFIIDSPVLSATESNEYIIQAVLGPNTIQLERAVPLYVLNEWVVARVRIRRRTGGAYLRFVPGRFTVKSPAPPRLWAENSFFDNSENIENNFGVLVGLTKAQMDSISENASYRQAVSGLMYAYTQGSAINQVLLGAQILLGLPFTERRGVILSIEDNYRLNSVGEPSLGRIVVEDLNDDGSRTNLVRIYTYPVDPISDLAGVATNPATGVAYVAGDTVEKFQPLSKGVEITDYVTDPTSDFVAASTALQQYHSIKARINDNVFSPSEIRLVSEFLNKITPSYIRVTLSSLTQFEDRVTITDVISTNKSYRISDDVAGSGASLNFDSVSINNAPQIFFDSSVYELRKFGFDLRTESLVGGPGSQQPFYSNDDLTHPSSATEIWEGARCIAGDFLFILSGPNIGKYEIYAISGDTGIASDAPEYGFAPALDQQFAILRKLQQTVKSGPSAIVATGSDLVTIEDSRLRTYGVRPGDWLLLGHPAKYTVTEVIEGAAGVWNTLRVTPTPSINFTGSYSIIRPLFLSPTSDETHQVFVSSGGTVLSAAEYTLGLLAEPGDDLVTETASILAVDPRVSGLGTLGKLVDGSHNVTIRRKSKQYRWDSFDPTVQDHIGLGISNGVTVTCSSGLDRVNLNISYAAWLPGDLLVFTAGANSAVDNGYGAGAFPISKVIANTVYFFRNLPNAGTHSWKIVRRR